MKANALKTIAEFHMLTQGDFVAVGVSGGADSVALLSLLCCLRGELDLTLVACHINHNLRGAEAKRDEDFVRRLCDRLGVECRVLSADVAALAREEGRSVEETARQVRYRFFAEMAGERGKIATAHTAADNTETVLLNLARGSGLRGLCGIPPVRENIIRPLIGCSREQTEAWCRQNGLEWVEDSTNAADDYTRNRLRHHAVPVLRQQNPTLDHAVSELSHRLRRDADFLDGLAQQEKEKIMQPNGRIDRIKLLELAQSLRDRILLGMMGEHIQPSSKMKDLCLQTAQQGQGSVELTRRVYFKADDHSVWCEESPQPSPVAEEVEIPPLVPGQKMVCQLGGRQVELFLWETAPLSSQNVYNYPLKNQLCYDKINGMLVLRTRRTGDRITLPRRGVSKTLKKLFCEEKIPQQERENRLVLAGHGCNVLWAEGVGPTASLLPDRQTKLVLELTIFEKNTFREDKQL